MKYLLFAVSFFFASQSFADFAWTQKDWQGKGVTVKSVYMHWENRWVTFSASDGKHYYYYWGSSPEPTVRAQMTFSTLLVAFGQEKRISIYGSTKPSQNGWYPFSYLNLHD